MLRFLFCGVPHAHQALSVRCFMQTVFCLMFLGNSLVAQERVGGNSVTISGAGPSTLQETNQEWAVVCTTPQVSESETLFSECELRHNSFQADTNQPVLVTTLRVAGDDRSTLMLITPLGLRLSEGIEITVAEEHLVSIPYQTCLQDGCVATADLSQSAVDRLVNAEEARFRMVTNTGQPLSVTVPLSGFAEAWTRFRELHNLE